MNESRCCRDIIIYVIKKRKSKLFPSQRDIWVFPFNFLCQSKLNFLRVVLAHFNDCFLIANLYLFKVQSSTITWHKYIYKLLQGKMFFKVINTNIGIWIIIRSHTIMEKNSFNLFYKIFEGLLYNNNYFWFKV